MEPDAQRKKILIVEDDDAQRRLLRLDLESSGYGVAEASGAHHALLFAETWAPDLILMHVSLIGRVDGWEVLKRLKANSQTASIPVIVVSGESGETHIKWSQAAGADDYLQKPYDLAELLMRLQRTLAAHSVTVHEEQHQDSDETNPDGHDGTF